MRIHFLREGFRNGDRRWQADPAEIVPLKVNQHDMFGALFDILRQRLRNLRVMGGIGGTRIGSCNRPGLDAAGLLTGFGDGFASGSGGSGFSAVGVSPGTTTVAVTPCGIALTRPS